MAELKLKMIAVYTKNSRVVGKVDGNVINSMKSGIIFRGENIKVAPETMFLNFFSPPYGKGVYKRNFRSTTNVVNSLGIYYEYGAVSKDQISFFHDLSDREGENTNFEKRMTENRAVLKTVLVELPDLNGYIEGKTYLNKKALDLGLVNLDTRFDNWFILQDPIFSRSINDFYLMNEFQKESGFTIDVVFMNLSKCNIYLNK